MPSLATLKRQRKVLAENLQILDPIKDPEHYDSGFKALIVLDGEIRAKEEEERSHA